jgi:hypothetical protein
MRSRLCALTSAAFVERYAVIANICNRISRHLTGDQLLDRKRTRIGFKPPDTTLLPADHHDHFPDESPGTARPGNSRRMIGQHKANLPHLWLSCAAYGISLQARPALVS